MATPLYRLADPGRGMFCDVDKGGNALPMPPTNREPQSPRHVDKTHQDHIPVAQRQRVREADRRRSLSQKDA